MAGNAAPIFRFDDRGQPAAVLDQGGTGITALPPVAGQLALPKWRKALCDVLTGTANARLVFTGDSTTAGLAPGASGTRAKSAPHLLGPLLAAAGIPVNLNIAFGDPTRNGGATFTAFDPRWTTAGTQWAPASVAASFGGQMLANTSTTETISFSPGAATANRFDSFEIYFMQNAGHGTFTVNVDGGATLATINSAGASQIVQRQVVNCALGNHVINIQRNGTGGAVYLYGIVCRDSTGPKCVEIYNGGSGGSPASDLAQGSPLPPYGVLYNSVVASIAPHLTVADIGINDYYSALYSPSFDVSLQAMLSCYLLSGDAIMCIPVPSQIGYSSFVSRVNMEAHYSAIYSVAGKNGVAVYDKRYRLKDYTTGNAAGLYADPLHPNPAGYASQAMDLARLLLA